MARNTDGKLSFTISLDNDQLRRDALQAQKAFQSIGNTAVSEGARIDTTFRNIAKSAGLVFGAQQAMQFARSIVQVRGEFQKLETAFGVLLGNKEKADKLMQDAVRLAATTPFSLQDVASGARQLLAYGFAADSIIDDLRRLGDVSAALGLPLERLTYLYGTTMTQGQLYSRDLLQFTTSGVPLLQALSDQFGVTNQEMRVMIEQGKIGFPEVQKAIYAMTGEGGQFNNMMGEMAKTIPGQIEKLKDAWQVMLNEIGKGQEGIIAGSIEAVSSLVENYEKVGKILIEIAATYGVYKAALIAVNFIEAQRIAFQGKVVRQMVIERSLRKGATMDMIREAAVTKTLAVAKQGLTNNLKTLAKSLVPNPYVLAAAAVAGLAFGIYKLITYQTDAEKAQGRLNDAIKESEKASLSETRELARLKGELSAATKGTDEYNKIKDKIVTGYGKYHDGLDEEIEKVGLLDSTYKSLTESIKASFGARQYEKFAQQEQDNLDELMSENLGKIQDRLIKKLGDETGSRVYAKIYDAILNGTASIGAGFKVSGVDEETQAALDKAAGDGGFITNRAVEGYIQNIIRAQQLTNDLDSLAKMKFGIYDNGLSGNDGNGGETETPKTYGDAVKAAQKEWDEAKKALTAIEKDKDSFTQEQYENAKARAETAKKAYADLGGVISSGGDSASGNSTKEIASLHRKYEDEVSQARVDAMDDGLEKVLAQNELNFQREKAQIEEEYSKLSDAERQFLIDAAQSRKTRADQSAKDAVLADMMSFADRYEKIIKDTNAKIKDAQMAGAPLDSFGVLSDQENEAINRLAEEYAAKSTDYEAFMRLMVDASEKEINAQIDNARSLISQIIEGGIGEEEIEKYLGYVARLNALQDQLKTKKPDTNPDKQSERDWKKLYSTLQKVEKEFNEIGDAVGGTAGEIISTAGTISTNTMQIIDGITSYSKIATQTIKGVSITAANAIKAVEKASVILAIIGAIISVLQSVAKLFKKDDYMEKYLAEVAAVNEELARLKLNAKIDSEDRETIFGTDGWAKAKDGVDAMREALGQYNDTLEEIAGRKEISILIDVNKVKSDIQSFDSLTDSIENMDVRIRHATWFRSAKYQSLKDAVPELFNNDGTVNMDALKGFIGSDTFNKLSEENQNYLERMSKDWETYQSAVEEVNNYLTDIFGDLGQNMSDALVDAFVNGTDAAMAFGDTVGDMLEQLAAQMVYSVTLGPLMEKYQKQFKDVMNNTEMTDEEKFANFTNILSNLTDDAIANQDLAQDLMQWAKDEAAKKGIEIFTPEEDTSETASRTSASQGFAQASQDSIDKIDGILTNIQNHTYGIFELMKSSIPGDGGSSIAFASLEAPVNNIAEMMRTNQQIQQANTDNILGRLTNIDMNTRPIAEMQKDIHYMRGRTDDMADSLDKFTR